MNSKLDIEARTALKALFDISKFSKNYLNSLFHVENVSYTIRKNKLILLTQLLSNNVTRNILLNMLASNPDYPLFTKNLAETAATLKVNLEEIIFQGKKPYVIAEYDEIPNETEEMLKFCVQYWNILPLRRQFKATLEECIPRKESGTDQPDQIT